MDAGEKRKAVLKGKDEVDDVGSGANSEDRHEDRDGMEGQ
jgi:hypothetical protein